MNTKGKIKVIKKGTEKTAEKNIAVEKKTNKILAREIVSNVSNWVNDFQHRRRADTQQAIDNFFGQNPQPNSI